MTKIQQYLIKRDNLAPLKFKGTFIASIGSSPDNALSAYSGSTGRSTDLNLYRTTGGNLVCEEIGYSQWEGEYTRYKACLIKPGNNGGIDEVTAFFGLGRLAQELYFLAGFDISIEVE